MSVTTMRSRLSAEDIQKLVKGSDEEARANAAHKICRRIAGGALSEQDRAAANQVLEFIASDAAELVRRALAVTLKKSASLPPHIAARLAEDLDSIAAPIIEFSPSLTDEVLVRLLETGEEWKQVAIAGRESVSNTVVRAIVKGRSEEAMATAAANDGAQFDRATYSATLKLWGRSEKVTGGFIERANIPVDVAEKLVSLVSDAALQRLASRHELPPQLAVELAEEARERATIDLIQQADASSDIHRFVQQLNLNARLTPSFILRAACSGAMRLFEHCMAELAGAPHAKAWLLIHDAGPLGLRAIFDRAGLPERIFQPIRTAVDIYHETEMDADPLAREKFSQRMIQRVLTERQSFSPDDLDYLLARLGVDDAPAGGAGAPRGAVAA